MKPFFFITVDAETEVVLDGVREITLIRDRLEREQGCSIPITWFVRFQRSWTDTVENDQAAYFESKLQGEFDGFKLLGPVLQELVKHGDEIGWHYHAHHYVMRDDLPHEVKIRNIAADLVSCASAIRSRYPCLQLSAFRWGWFFTPDFRLQKNLHDLGFVIDASIFPGRAGTNVAIFSTRYLQPVTLDAATIDGTHYYPFVNTLLVHDYNVVAHQMGWTNQDEQAAAKRKEHLARDMSQLLQRARDAETGLTTYRAAAGIG